MDTKRRLLAEKVHTTCVNLHACCKGDGSQRAMWRNRYFVGLCHPRLKSYDWGKVRVRVRLPHKILYK